MEPSRGGHNPYMNADKMKKQRGSLPQRLAKTTISEFADALLIKYTINPAVAHGVSEHTWDR